MSRESLFAERAILELLVNILARQENMDYIALRIVRVKMALIVTTRQVPENFFFPLITFGNTVHLVRS